MTRTPYSDSSDDELDPETNDMSDTEQQSAWPYPGPRKTRESLLPKLALKPWLEQPSEDCNLLNCRIIDSVKSRLLPGLQAISIAKGKIVSVCSMDEAGSTQGNQRDRVNTVDLKGAFVCPGLIDCHVHVTAVPGVKTMSELVRTPEEVIHYRTTYILGQMIRNGFTTVRDTGGASRPLAQAISENLILGPRLIQCGKAISQTGGHGDFSPAISGGEKGAGCCGGHSASLGRVADGVPAVLRATREELKAGADFIKIMVGGGVASESDGIETVQYTSAEIQAITTTCHQMGRRHTTAHAYTDEAIRHAVDNGVKGIEHGNLLTRSTAQYMAQKKIYLTPTLSCYGIMARPPFEDFLTPEGYEKNREVMKQGLNALKMAVEEGVVVCYGSDLLTSMHALQTEEFTVRAEILNAGEILKHATCNAAEMLGMKGKIGTIECGAFGDLLVLNSNPLEDITILDRPEEHLLVVMKQGKVITSLISGLN